MQGGPCCAELEHYGIPFSRTDRGTIYQRTLGGHTTEYGKGGQAYRTACASDRTGHAMLHTLYGKSLQFDTEYFVEYFATDLIMRESNSTSPPECVGIMAMCMEDGTMHRFHSKATVLATGGYGRAYFSATAAHTHGRRWRDGLRAGACQDPEFVQFHQPAFAAPAVSSRGCRGEAVQEPEGREVHGEICPVCKGLGIADVVSRAMTMEVMEGRGCGRARITFTCISTTCRTS